MFAAMPDSSSAANTLGTRCASVNWRDVRLIDMHSEGKPSRCQATCCAHTVFSTQLPIGIISPVSSAKGRNLDGAMMPKSGWCQRSSASTPVMA